MKHPRAPTPPAPASAHMPRTTASGEAPPAAARARRAGAPPAPRAVAPASGASSFWSCLPRSAMSAMPTLHLLLALLLAPQPVASLAPSASAAMVAPALAGLRTVAPTASPAPLRLAVSGVRVPDLGRPSCISIVETRGGGRRARRGAGLFEQLVVLPPRSAKTPARMSRSALRKQLRKADAGNSEEAVGVPEFCSRPGFAGTPTASGRRLYAVR